MSTTSKTASPAPARTRIPARLNQRMRPLQLSVFLQGLALWVPVEKLFMTQIGFTAATIGVMAAAYAAITPLLEVPSGIVADRGSRRTMLMLAAGAGAAAALVGGISQNVATYFVAALLLGAYFALSSGTVDSVVYDLALEETGSSDLYERLIGRVRVQESAALMLASVGGGLLAGWTSPRVTYLVTVPITLVAILVLLRFEEPTLHRAGDPVGLRQHVRTTFGAMTRLPQVRQALALAALAAMISQVVFEFGPLWLVAANASPALYGPYWAILVATLGLAGYLASRVPLDRIPVTVATAVLITVAAVLLTITGTLALAVAAQFVLALAMGILGIHTGRLLHDAVPSSIRAGVSSGAGTLSWVLFLPFSFGFGWLTNDRDLHVSGWLLVVVVVALAVLLVVATRSAGSAGEIATAAVADEAGEVDGTLTGTGGRPVGVVPGSAPAPAPAADAGSAVASAPAGGDSREKVACRELVEVVTEYLDRTLPLHRRRPVNDHLAGCDGCTQYVAQIRELLRALGEEAPDHRVPGA